MKVDKYVQEDEQNKIRDDKARSWKEEETKQRRTDDQLSLLNEIEKQNDLRNILLQRENECKKFEKIVKEIERDIIVEEEDELEGVAYLVEYNLKTLEKFKGTCEESHRAYEINSDEALGRNDRGWMDDILDIYHETTRGAKLFISKHKIKEIRNTYTNLKLEKLRFQEFDGSLGKYPMFKQDFIKLIKPNYRETEEAFARHSYSPSVREEVEHLDDDCESIWQRLDEKYGNESKLIDLLMHDMKRLRINRDDYNVDALKLINTVEKAHCDLKAMDREGEISNAAVVAMLEEKLPKKIDDWLEIVTGERACDIDKFPSLLKLLLKHKGIIEYKTSSIRMSKMYHILQRQMNK